MVNSDGEVIIIERPKPTTPLRPRWIKADEVDLSQVEQAKDEEDLAPVSVAQSIGQLVEVIGRSAGNVDVNIPLAVAAPSQSSQQQLTRSYSNRIRVLGQNDGDELPQILADLLRDSGEQMVEFEIVPTQVSIDQIRFFHEDDQFHAEYVAGLLDDVFENLQVRNYTNFNPKPPEGLLEIWIQ